jgi:SAM-dependent methyltransferase
VTETRGRGPEGWDERYRQRGPEPREPEPALVDALAPLPPGCAVDLAAGAGRHALWLAARGWRVTAVDFSAVGVEHGRVAAAAAGLRVGWVVADVRDWAPAPDDPPVDLVLAARVRLDPEVLQRAAGWLAPGGRLVVLGHAAAGEWVDGPRDPALRHTRGSLVEAAEGLLTERLEHVARPGGAQDLLLVARRPPGEAAVR